VPAALRGVIVGGPPGGCGGARFAARFGLDSHLSVFMPVRPHCEG
jgi:hypothetical protein